MPAVDCPSPSQVNKAGRTIRKGLTGDGSGFSEDQLNRAFDVMLAYRAAHQYPLTKANMGLRSMVRSENCEVEVSQRLKKAMTIIDKLVREPTMQLANMQDIGGCRAVLNSVDEVRRVERRLRKNRPPLRVSDYIENPPGLRLSGCPRDRRIRPMEDRDPAPDPSDARMGDHRREGQWPSGRGLQEWVWVQGDTGPSRGHLGGHGHRGGRKRR